jgi:uroporphyrin-III C-methyltransferase
MSPAWVPTSGVAHIQDELLYGLPDTTPVAVVQNASLPTQRHAVCTLGELQTTIARDGLASPSVIVVGDVMQGLLAAVQVPEREPLGQTRTA